ncbi:MAG: hypothetical protein K6T86_21880 [Pirellulales bacterium]|nr:hypothetical protein [Pirellulales bacterium]
MASQHDARKQPLGPAQAVELAREVDEIYVAKGKQVVHVNLKQQKPAAEELASLLLGPTGNLRAPALRLGRTLIVGFDEPTYRKLLLKGKL